MAYLNEKDWEKIEKKGFTYFIYLKILYKHIGYYRAIPILVGSFLMGLEFNWVVGVAVLCLVLGLIDLNTVDFKND